MKGTSKKVRKFMLLLTGACLLLGLNGCVSKCFYYPTRDVYQTPSRWGLKYEEVWFESRDGTRINGWFVPAVGPAEGTVIYFHGNAGNMTAHFSFVAWLPEERFNVFIFDYRGYSKSGGKVNRKGVYEDSIAAIKYVQSRSDIDRDRLFVFGQSLGGANALAVLGRNEFAGIKAVVIESTFYSYRSIVREKIGQMPVLSLLRWPLSFLVVGNSYSPGPVVNRIAPIPLLLIHGTADPVISDRHSRWLYDKAEQPKSLWIIEGGGHTEGLKLCNRAYRERLVSFFEGALSNGRNKESN